VLQSASFFIGGDDISLTADRNTEIVIFFQ